MEVIGDIDGLAEPVQIGATHLWGRSQRFKPARAVNAVESATSVASARGWAITLAAQDRAGRDIYIDGVRSSHQDLAATADWLVAA